MSLAADIGTLTVKVATGEGVTSLPAPPGGPRAAIRAALAAASPRSGLCVAVPDAWLTGEAAGAALLEDVRHECEDQAGAGPVTWTGQLAAVAALIVKARGGGRCLVCDAGGDGVRAGTFDVSGPQVKIVATQAAAGGGWRDFDALIRSTVPAGLPATWFEQAAGQGRRARIVLGDAAESPEELQDARVYRISGAGADLDLTARQLIDSFAPTAERIRDCVRAVTSARAPDVVVLTGGLGWLPLAARAIAGVAEATPMVTGVDAAARGALLFARSEALLAPPAACPAVTLPTHRIRDGLLEEVGVTLTWTEPFADLPGGALMIERSELELTVAGQPRVARLSGLAPGPHRVGVRPSWPGPGVLVVRPVTGDGAHIVPLASLDAR